MINGDRPDLMIYTPTLDGGVGRILFNLSKGLAEKNYRVEILANQITPESFVSPDIKVVNFNQPRTFKNLFIIAKYLREKKPKSFMSVIYHGNLVSMISHALSFSKSRMIICEHIALGQALDHEPALLRNFLKILIRIFYRFAHTVITVSRSAADELKAHGVPSRKIKVIYNPVITPDLLSQSNDKIDHAWFNPKSAPIILSIGRLTPQKDFETLIRSFAEIRKRKSLKLMILGDGPEKDRLDQLIKELGIESEVDMPGFVNNPYSYFKYADLFVLSSRWEGLPTVLIEALAFGLPVVATDCPSGPREILKNGKLGRLVPVGDVNAMSDAIIQTIEHPLPKPGAQDLVDFSVASSVAEYEKVLF